MRAATSRKSSGRFRRVRAKGERPGLRFGPALDVLDRQEIRDLGVADDAANDFKREIADGVAPDRLDIGLAKGLEPRPARSVGEMLARQTVARGGVSAPDSRNRLRKASQKRPMSSAIASR